MSRHKNKKICQVNTMLFTQEGTGLTRIYPKGFCKPVWDIRNSYEVLGIPLRIEPVVCWEQAMGFWCLLFTNIFIIQHHFLFVNTKNKIFNDFFIRYFYKSFTMNSIFRLSPIERCFYFCRSFKRSTGHSRTTVLLTCWLLFLCLFAVKKENYSSSSVSGLYSSNSPG